MHVHFERGQPSPSFMTRLRALCEDHDIDLVAPAKRRCPLGIMDTVTALVRLLVVTTNARIVYVHHVLCQHLQVFLKAVQLLMVETHIRDIHCTASSGES